MQDGYLPEYMYIMEAYKVNKEEAIELLLEAENGLPLVETTSDEE